MFQGSAAKELNPLLGNQDMKIFMKQAGVDEKESEHKNQNVPNPLTVNDKENPKDSNVTRNTTTNFSENSRKDNEGNSISRNSSDVSSAKDLLLPEESHPDTTNPLLE